MKNTNQYRRMPYRHVCTAFMTSGVLILLSCGGGSNNSPSPGGPGQPSGVSAVFASSAATSRFLGKATYGPTQSDIDTLTGTEASDWIRSEFAKPATAYLQPILDELAPGERLPNRRFSDHFFDNAITADDQLRQRMIFALSEIMVVSNDGQLSARPDTIAHYVEVLSTHAFGNYRDLMEDMTYAPAMGFFLTYLGNRKGDPATGRVPDENYARELLQLFTIGLTELNMDGTQKLDSQGEPIEIYDNDDITGLARVFTGLSWDRGATYSPMRIYPGNHSELEKSFLGTTIPAGTNAEQSIDMALDTIFAHPNVAPFISRQLIQRFTVSSPRPAYVQRVAESFEGGRYTLPDGSAVGTGIRGDLKAVIAAILFDADALQNPATASAQHGKIREPIIRFVNWARAFNETTPDARDERDLASLEPMGQHPFLSPSVFNFFRPGFIAPGTETGEAGLTVPELQIVNESSLIAYINFINGFIYDFHGAVSDVEDGGVVGDYTAEIALAETPQDLIDHLNLLLTGNSLAPETQTRILEMLGEMPIREGTEADDRAARVKVAISMVMTAPGYLVQK